MLGVVQFREILLWTSHAIFCRQVTKAAPLVFTVTDREDVLGTVTVPLDQIPSAIHKRRWVSLSKKNTTVSGELCFDCWVTSFQKQTEGGAKWSLKATGFMRDKMKRRSSIEMSSISLKGSRSVENLYSTPELSPNSPSVGSLKRASSGILGTANEGSKTNLSSNSPFRCPSSLETSTSTQRCVSQPTPVAIRNSKTTLIVPEITRTLSSSGFESNFTPATITPEITGLSPKCGPVSGGTRITLRGRNLGNCLEDIMSLSVCGCDLLSTLEYHSSAKLVCVTKPWNGCGPVVIVTKSAGRGSSTVTFSFETQQNNEGKEIEIPKRFIYLFIFVTVPWAYRRSSAPSQFHDPLPVQEGEFLFRSWVAE